jgi:hypothetical protein
MSDHETCLSRVFGMTQQTKTHPACDPFPAYIGAQAAYMH